MTVDVYDVEWPDTVTDANNMLARIVGVLREFGFDASGRDGILRTVRVVLEGRAELAEVVTDDTVQILKELRAEKARLESDNRELRTRCMVAEKSARDWEEHAHATAALIPGEAA